MVTISRLFCPEASWASSWATRRNVTARHRPYPRHLDERNSFLEAVNRDNRRRTMPRVVHFEIPADNPESAAAFYKKAFGWKIEKWPGPMDYWMVNTGADGEPGINGGLLKKGDVSTTTNTVGVQSVDDAIAAVSKAGGKLIMPKTPIPTVG